MWSSFGAVGGFTLIIVVFWWARRLPYVAWHRFACPCMVTRRARRAEHLHCLVRYASDRRVSSGSAFFASGRRVARGSGPHVAFISGSARDTGHATAHYVELAIGPVCDAGVASCFVCSAGFAGGSAFFANRVRGDRDWLLVTG